MSEWISVKDKLPKPGRDVLVLIQGVRGRKRGLIDIGWLELTHRSGPGGSQDVAVWDVERGRGDGPEKVTHWMSFPKLPKINKEEAKA